MTAACKTLVVTALAGALVGALAPTARADQRAEADAAFKHGREAFKAEKYQEACDAFEESQSLDPQLGTKFNLAQCYEKVGKLATAYTMYNELLALDDNTFRKHLTTDALAALEPRVPKIQVVIDKPPPDVVVTIQDAKGVGRPADLNAPTRVDVGDYKVVAVAKGMRDWISPTTHASEGQVTQIVVVLAPGEQKPKPEPVQSYSIWDPPARKRLRATAIVAGGGALVVGSLIVGYLAYSDYQDAQSTCGGRSMCATPADLAKATSLNDAASLRGTISTVMFGVGVATIATGTVMYMLAKHEEPVVAPQVGATSVGVSLSGRF